MLAVLFKKVINRIKSLKPTPANVRFAYHNKRIFPKVPYKKENTPVILIELNTLHSAHIAYSYLANVLAAKNNAQIKAYIPHAPKGKWEKLSIKINTLSGINEFGTYQSFGSTDVITISLDNAQKSKAKKLFLDTFTNIKNKYDIENLTIHGVWIGDLIYDTYLMRYKKPTIDKSSSEFLDFLLESLEAFVFWEDYFNTHDIRGVNVSHCVYNLAMPLRIAVARNIPAYQSNISHVYRLSKTNYFAYSDFYYFPERFLSLPENVKKLGIDEAKKRLDRRFSGEVGVDMSYSTKSAYGLGRKQRTLRESSQKKVLIATHCFFDSPHSYGNNLFPDFYEWLDFLGKISEITNYDWYIKTHPDYLPGTMEIVEGFIRKYPRITLLPADTSHHQIIAEGIDVALTVLGTIGFEYAALGIPVINASLCNPHIAYNFNVHARDIEHYRELLLNLEKLDLKIDPAQVYEYYFMRHIFNTENFFFKNYVETINVMGGYLAQFSPKIYDKWLEEWSPEKHEKIIESLRHFIQSEDFRMDCKHAGEEFKIESIGIKSSLTEEIV